MIYATLMHTYIQAKVTEAKERKCHRSYAKVLNLYSGSFYCILCAHSLAASEIHYTHTHACIDD